MFPLARFRSTETSHGASARAGLLAFLALTGASCSRIEQAGECRDVAGIVNVQVVDLEALTLQPRTASRLREIAKRYRSLADSVGPIPVSDKQLALDLAEYSRAVRRTAEATDKAAKALEQKDNLLFSNARRELGLATQSARLSLRKVEQYCTGQRAGRW